MSPAEATRRRRRTPSPNGHDPVIVTEDVVEDVERTRDRLRQSARQMLGVTGSTEGTPSLAEGIRASGAGWYPLVVLGVLIVVDQFQAYAFFVLGPEISVALGVSKGVLAGLVALKTLAVTLAALPIAAYVQRKPRRAVVSIVAAFAWGVMTLATGFVTSAWGLLAVLVADGLSSGSVAAVHQPLVMDSYPPSVRVRALSFYRAAEGVGNIVAPLLVGLFTALLGFTWRGVFVAMGVSCLAAALVSVRLRDPGFGRWDTDRVRLAVRQAAGAEASETTDATVSLGFFEITRRLFLIPTVRRILAAQAVLGMLLVPLLTYLFFFLEDRWGMGPGSRSLFYAVMPVFAMGTLWLFGRRGDGLFRRDPALVLRLAALFLLGDVVSLALAIFSPFFIVMVVLFGVAFGCFAVMTPALNMALLSIVPPRMRPHASALAGIFLAGVGGFGGLVLLGGLERRWGTAGAIASLAVPGIAAAFVLYTAAKTVNDDLDRMLDDIVEEEELQALAHQGTRLPMLACRHVDFSYGQLQVLFDVSFTVDEGELVALLGTNGAGKSTLLRVVCGLGLPTRGSVRYRGHDVTYVDAERRLRLGIIQITGGKAVFGPMSVVENMRVFGYTHGADRRAVEAGIEAALDAFPALAARRHQPASTMSGGEQQMLALSKAFILRPRLLLIDELSLGLAPKVVGELLEMVRRINAAGTAVVLVEQSVNVALSVAEHAYFMEKGEIRFDGRSEDLLSREDLLRSVFLEGAAKGWSGA